MIKICFVKRTDHLVTDGIPLVLVHGKQFSVPFPDRVNEHLTSWKTLRMLNLCTVSKLHNQRIFLWNFIIGETYQEALKKKGVFKHTCFWFYKLVSVGKNQKQCQTDLLCIKYKAFLQGIPQTFEPVNFSKSSYINVCCLFPLEMQKFGYVIKYPEKNSKWTELQAYW